MTFDKKEIQKLGKVYDYLRDGHLRSRELGSQRVSIKNVNFTESKFQGTSWQYFDFVDCEFGGQYSIRLEWLTDSTFTNCRFTGYVMLNHAINVRFLNCVVNGESLLSFSGKSTNLAFESCTFSNPDYDPNHESGIISHGEVLFINCKAEGFVLEAYKKLILRHCTTNPARLATAPSGLFSDKSKMPYADFLLENCNFTRGVSMINAKLNSLTMRSCKVGVFKTAGSVVRGDVLVEGIKKGFLRLSASDFQGKLTVRDCRFYTTVEGHSFKCNVDTPVYSLIENVQCGKAPVDLICSGGPMKESDWLPVASNQSTIIRNCDIPHLHVDWMQSEHLRIENCHFDTLLIRNGRIGKLEIIGCRLKKLDVSNTKVQEQDVRVQEGGKISGHITVTTGSNIKLLPKD